MLDKLKNLSIHSKISPSGEVAPQGKGPDKAAIYRNRHNFGVNLGSVFVLEKFMYGDLFVDNAGAELDAVRNLVKKKGEDEAKRTLESHWASYMNDGDWEWLKSKGVTAVRIPIGYWCVDGGKYAADTHFAQVAKVYQNAWTFYKKLIAKASNYDIGVLVDLHAVPKGANTGDHSGETLSKAGFWDSSSSQKKAVEVVTFMAKEVGNIENIVALQIVNESEFSNSADAQKAYYSKAIDSIRSANATIPIVISDGWWPDQWASWIAEKEAKMGKSATLGVIVDCHCYRCFSDADKNKSPEKIIDDLHNDLLTNLSSSADILVGEYSCVLDGSSWGKTKNDRKQLVAKYGQTQQAHFNYRANCGSYFWTYKFQHGDGGEWGFRPMVESNSIPARPTSVKSMPSKDDFNDMLNKELKAHSDYWHSQNSHEHYQHDRYQDGFTTAWADATAFASFNGSRLGRLRAWSKSRLAEHIKAKGDSSFTWEWEAGFNKGVESFNRIAFGL